MYCSVLGLINEDLCCKVTVCKDFTKIQMVEIIMKVLKC